MLKLCLVINSLSAGGAEKQMVLLGEALSRAGHQITIITFDSSEPFYPLPDSIQFKQLGFCFKGKPILKKIALIPALLLDLRAAMDNLESEAVISFLDQVNIFCLLTNLFGNRVLLIAERSFPAFSPMLGKSRVRRWLVGKLRVLLYNRAARVVVQTEAARQYLLAERILKITVIPNMVVAASCASRIPGVGGQHYLLCVGRLVQSKRFEIAIAAFSKVSRTFPELRLVIVGDGPLKADLRCLAEELGIVERVDLVSAVPDLAPFYQNARLFIQTSESEGFPGVLAEAMSNSCGCIASDCLAGPADLIEDGINGLLVPVGETAILSEKIIYLLSNPLVAAGLGKKAAAISQKYAASKIGQLWLAEIAGVASPKP